MAEEKVVLVEKPEDWLEATAVKGELTLTTPSGPVKLQLRAVSFGEWEEIQRMCPKPKPPLRRRGMFEEPDEKDPDYIREDIDNLFKQFVGALDASWKKLPGENLEDKVRWVRENIKEGHIWELHGKIMELSGRNLGRADDENMTDPKLLETPEEWAKISQLTTYGTDR